MGIARSAGNAKVSLVPPALLALAFLALAIGLFPSWLRVVDLAGKNFLGYPGEDIAGDYLLGVAWTLLLGAGILFWPVPGRDKKALLGLWAVKALFVLGVTLAFEYRYGLDMDGYYTNGSAPGFIWEGFQFGNGTKVMWHLAWLQNLLTPGSYHAAKASCAMLGLVAVYLFYRAAVLFLGREDRRVLWALALFPSILFWSSFLTKDPVAMFGMALYVYGVVSWRRLGRWRSLVWIVLGALVMALIRMWLVPVAVAPLIVMGFLTSGRGWRRAVPLGVAALALVLVLPALLQTWRVQSVGDLYELRSNTAVAFAGGGSSQAAPEVADLGGAITLTPLAVFTALFRPLPGEVSGLFGLLQGLDNLALLLLLGLAVVRTRLVELSEPLVLWALVLVLAWAGLYGLVAYNFGALARYKLQVLPMLLGLLLYFARRRSCAG